MNRKQFGRILPAALAFSLAFAPAAYAEAAAGTGTGVSQTSGSGSFAAEPGNLYDDETKASIWDNVLEYGEIETLIDACNPTLKTLRETWSENRDAAKDVAKLKEQILSASGNLADTASTLRSTASQLENAVAYKSTSVSYASVLYSSELLEVQAEQYAMQADSMTETTPEMLRLQLIDTNRAALISGAQSAMIGREQVLLNKESLEDSIELLQMVLTSTESRASIGMATQNDVLDARHSLESAQAGLLTIESTEQQLRQTLNTLLGWEYNASPEIRTVPEPDLARIASMDPNADLETAVAANFTLRYNELSYDTMDQGSVTQQNLARTIAQEKEQIASSLQNLYNDVLQKKSDLETAEAALALEKTRMDAANRKLAIQTIGKLEYRQEQNAYKTKEIAVKTAKLDLLQAMETYDWALKGSLSIS